MNEKCEWKELNISNIPGDFLIGDYEFEYLSNGHWLRNKRIEVEYKEERGVTLYNATAKYRYRKAEPKQPSHEEIY